MIDRRFAFVEGSGKLGAPPAGGEIVASSFFTKSIYNANQRKQRAACQKY